MDEIKNILITGATGYLGSNLAKKLVENGYNLIILKRSGSSLSKIETIVSSVTLINIDEANFNELFENVQIDAIINTAVSYGRKGEDIAEVYDANLFFPLRLLQYAINHKTKYFLNAATTLPPTLNNYSLSKNQFSQVLKMQSSAINVIDIELQYFFGPGDDASKFVTFILSKLNSAVSYIDLSPGTQVRDFIYIDDVTSAYLVLLKNIKTLQPYQAISLGTGIGITLKSLVEKIKSKLDNHHTALNFGALPLRVGEAMNVVADITFLNSLGWKPSFTIDEGLNETIKIEKLLFV